jgi:hypothetical protein
MHSSMIYSTHSTTTNNSCSFCEGTSCVTISYLNCSTNHYWYLIETVEIVTIGSSETLSVHNREWNIACSTNIKGK